MRLFVAVPIPHETSLALDDWAAHLDLPGRPVPVENLHLTLRFVGDSDDVGYDRLLAELDQIDPRDPFRIRLEGLGAFPNARRATVAWCGVTGETVALEGLAADVDEAVDAAGFGVEDRPFAAHVTLARIRPPAVLDTAVGGPGLRVSVDEFVVFRSHLGAGGVTYEPIERFSLT